MAMFRFKYYCVSALALGLAACSTAAGPAFTSPESATQSGLYGDYLAASYADKIDAADERSSYFSSAFLQDASNVSLGQRAFLASLTANEISKASKLALELQKLDRNEGLSRVFLSAQAMSKQQWSRAKRYQKEDLRDVSVDIMMSIMNGWTEFELGNDAAALAAFKNINGGPFFTVLGAVQTAKLHIARGNWDEASEALDFVKATSLLSTSVVLIDTEILFGRGDIDGAKEQLARIEALNGGFTTGPIKTQIDALDAGTFEIPTRTAAQLASTALTEPSLTFFTAQGATEAAEIFLRHALILNSKNDQAHLWLGSILVDEGRNQDAIAAYQNIPDGSDYKIAAKLSHANILFANDDEAGALVLLKRADADGSSRATQSALARAYLVSEDYVSALPIYDKIIAGTSAEDLKANPTALYRRAISYEQLDQWDLAEVDFKRVLELDPDNVDALNYLGYSWVDKNINLTQAFEMIRKAVRLEPQSGAIVDSLGWAHFKLGQYSEAKNHLEDAVALSPSSATIIDHLGDVYWKLGRFREAGYQWQRALDFDPSDKENRQIEAKLKGGLDAARGIE